MIYEEEATFINDNYSNDLFYNDALYQKASVSQNKMLIKKSFISQLYHPAMEEKSMSNQFLKSKKEQCKKDLNLKNNVKKMTAPVINDSCPMIKVKTTPFCTCVEISNILQDLDEGNNA